MTLRGDPLVLMPFEVAQAAPAGGDPALLRDALLRLADLLVGRSRSQPDVEVCGRGRGFNQRVCPSARLRVSPPATGW